jgi:hypothetical protein
MADQADSERHVEMVRPWLPRDGRGIPRWSTTCSVGTSEPMESLSAWLDLNARAASGLPDLTTTIRYMFSARDKITTLLV